MHYEKALSRVASTAKKITLVPGTLKEQFYMASRGFGNAPFPKMLAIPLTAQCNYHCNFCEIVGVRQVLKETQQPYCSNELSLEHLLWFKDLIRKARKIDFGGVTSLGEPLLAKDFEQAILTIRRLNKSTKILLTTNGSLLMPEVANLLVSAAPLSVTFSLHAASQEIYHKVMGPGYSTVIENIRYFCERARNSGQIKTVINFGLGMFNLSDAKGIVVLAKELGIDKVYIYPYYKSPNKFMEDVSLYSTPERANNALDAAYQRAREIGQPIVPKSPPYITLDKLVLSNVQPYQGGCLAPFENFLLKADPYHPDKVAVCVCNRIVLFLLDLKGQLSQKDLLWMWNHPVIHAMRFPQKRVPDICRFCKDPKTPVLRSFDHSEYKKRRDAAVWNDLARFQADKLSPNRSIELLSENIFSID